MRIKIDMVGDGFTEAQTLLMKNEIVSYADAHNLKGTVLIVEPIQ